MKAEGKRIYVKALLITLISLMCSVRAWSQAGVIYPVDINVTLTPPYGTCLTDLTNSDRFRIQALMRDMSHPEYEMVIQMMIRDLSSFSPVFISTTNAFSLTAGEPTKVIGRDVSFASIADFFNIQNIRIGAKYVGTKCLPEGAYLFSFQAFDAKSYRTNRIPISREVTFSAFLEGGEVPILTYPAQNDSICDVQSIHFTWMQPFVSSGVNTYRLQILKSNTEFPLPAKELLDNPNTNDRIEVTTLIPSYTFHDIYNFLEEKTTYYWRVVMCDADGNARLSYPNKGASEVRSFVYCGKEITPEPDPDADWVQKKPQVKSIKDNLDTVKLIKAEEDGPDVVRAFCKKDVQEIREKYSGIIVEVKKKSHDTWTPFSIESKSVEDTSVSLGNLAYNEVYQARAQYYIDEGESTTYAPYSDTIEFTISNPADTIECGSPLPELNSDCTEAPKELKEGDKFSANGATVTVLEVTSQSVEGNKLKISGTGYVNFPILRNFKLKVKFENAVLNCNLQLEDGTVESVHDLSTAATIDLNNLLGKGAGGYDLPETDPSIVDIPGIDPKNCEECKSYESGTLFSSGGEVYMKDENGAVVSVGKEIDLSTSGEYESNEIRKDNILVWFSNPDPANIAFDNDSMGYYRNIASINDQYTLFATNYIIPWVANNPGRVVTLTAKPSDDFTNSGYTEPKFVLKTSATSYVALNQQTNDDGTYSVTIPGTDPSNITHIYAIARPAAGKPYENVGQLKVACYEKKTQKVILVPVANVEPNAETVKSYLTSVYGKLGYSFDVEVDNDKSHVEGINSDQISISSGIFTQYSDEMSSVINTYTSRLGDSYDKSAAYLFLMKKASGDNASVGGIMPQKHQFGFIFLGGTKDVDNRTIAHELGHGLWGLDHTFVKAYKIPEGTTPHLMDYNNGVYLAHFEWSQIDKPVKSWALFNSDKDNQFDPTACAIKVVGGILIDAGFELYSQYKESEQKGGIDGWVVMEAGLAGAPARILDCVDIRKFKKVWTSITDMVCKYMKAIDKCKREEAIKFDSYDHCMCEERFSIFTDQVIGIIVGELIGDVKKPEGKSKKEALEYFVQLVYPDFTVDYVSSVASEYLSEKLCGKNPFIKDPPGPDPGSNPGELYCGMPNYYIQKEDKDGLISICVYTISDYSSPTSLGLRNLDKDVKWTESHCDPETGKVEFISDNSNTPLYENIYIPSELSSNIDIEFIGNDEYNLPHYRVKNPSEMSEDVLYLVWEREVDYNASEALKLYTIDNNGEPLYMDKMYIKEYVYKLKPSCLSPNNKNNYISVRSDFSATFKLAEWQQELTDFEYYRCVNGNLCGQEIPDDDTPDDDTPGGDTPGGDTPKPEYPKYFDDECNCKGLDDSVCDKNPFGQIKQTGPKKYENSSPRKTNEGRRYDDNHVHGIPKCSGWKLVKEENGCKTYSVSPRLKCSGKYIPDMYTVTMCEGKDPVVVDNDVDLSKYQYDFLEYWDGHLDIIGTFPNVSAKKMGLDEFCEKVTADGIILRAFVAMYADWLCGCASGAGTPSYFGDRLNEVYSGSDSFMNYYIRLSMNEINDKIGINRIVTKKFIEEALNKLPAEVINTVNTTIKKKYTASSLKEKIKKDCKVGCVFFDMMYDVADVLYHQMYNGPYVSDSENMDDAAKFELQNYFAILGYKLYYPKEGYNCMGIRDAVKQDLLTSYGRSEDTSNILYYMFVYKSEEEVQERVAEIEARYKELLKNTNNKTALEQEKEVELRNAKDKNRIPNIFFDFFKDKKCK